MSKPRQLTPQEEARLAQVRKNFQERRQISENLQSIKKKIGIYSGKGGVGKTTVATNLAIQIAKSGFSVSLFDCDIDCPNVTKTLHISEGPIEKDGKLIPPSRHGVSVMSMSFFQEDEETAIIWRGPMIHNAINQFLHSTQWGELDFMIVDLPPGTSDAPLTVMQTLHLDGFIVVTTPQDLAALDAKRSINMIRKLNLEVIGIVENMSGDIFGRGAGEEISKSMGIPFFGSIELRKDYKTSKSPTVLESEDVEKEYSTISNNLLSNLNF